MPAVYEPDAAQSAVKTLRDPAELRKMLVPVEPEVVEDEDPLGIELRLARSADDQGAIPRSICSDS